MKKILINGWIIIEFKHSRFNKLILTICLLCTLIFSYAFNFNVPLMFSSFGINTKFKLPLWISQDKSHIGSPIFE